MKKSPALLIFLAVDVLIVIAGAWLFLRHPHFFTSHNTPAPQITQRPSVTHLSLSAGQALGDYTLYALPGDLGQAKINDIVFAAGAMWLGTKKGLVKIQGSQVTVYRQFSDWPYQWIEHVAVTPVGLAVNTLVAQHNYGGNYAGSYLFDIQHETWQRLGRTVRAQAWLDGYLYQASTRLIRRDPQQAWREQVVLPDICAPWTARLVMRAISGELWLTGDSVRRNSPGCGVIRYNPKTGQHIVYTTRDGLNDNSGWDIGGDAAAVFVAHSGRSARVSHFDLPRQTWQSLRAGGTGHRISVTPQAIWLAALSTTQPLIRIDRRTDTATSLPALDDKEYVSALGVNGPQIWFGTYITTWHGQGYTIQSRLGRYIDKSMRSE